MDLSAGRIQAATLPTEVEEPLQSFKVPVGGESYCLNVQNQIDNYIRFGLWEGVSQLQVEKWMKNFTTSEERYFACRLLDYLIYRSEEQVVAMLKQIFQVTLPNAVRKHSLPLNPKETDFLKFFAKGTYDCVRLVAAFKPSDPPSKSAAHIFRLLKRRFGREIEKISIFPNMVRPCIKTGVNCFIFLDDFLGTGTQFHEVLRDHDLTTWPKNTHFLYLPLVAHNNGIKFLNDASRYPRLIVSPAEILTEKHQLFHESSECFNDGTNTTAMAKAFYYDMLKEKGIHIYGSERRGFGKLEVAYSFSHASPDNTLPILWYAEDGWTPLFKR